MKKFFAVLAVFILPLSAAGGDRASDFKKMIRGIYNFRPGQASDELKSRKGREMDRLWELVGSDKSFYLPLLRKELDDPANDPFFFFDGSSLLLKYSAEKEDLERIARAISRCSLADVDNTMYFRMTHMLGCRGIDTYPAIENMLGAPGFTAIIPEHAITLAQDYSVLYCLLCLDDSVYIDRLAARLAAEKNPVAAKTIILALAFTVTEKGQKAIRDFGKETRDPGLASYAEEYSKLESKKDLPSLQTVSDRKYFNEFLDAYLDRKYQSDKFNFETYRKEAYYMVRKEDYGRIKELRKKRAQRVSDEAFAEIAFLTMLLQYSFTSAD